MTTVCGLVYHHFIINGEISTSSILLTAKDLNFGLLLPLLGPCRNHIVEAAIIKEAIAINYYACISVVWKEMMEDGSFDYPRTIQSWHI